MWTALAEDGGTDAGAVYDAVSDDVGQIKHFDSDRVLHDLSPRRVLRRSIYPWFLPGSR